MHLPGAGALQPLLADLCACTVRTKVVNAGVRQTSRMRHAYLASVLQQEVAYFDTDTSSGKLLSGLNEDVMTIQNGISEKAGNFVHHIFTFVVGIAIGKWLFLQNFTCMLKCTSAAHACPNWCERCSMMLECVSRQALGRQFCHIPL